MKPGAAYAVDKEEEEADEQFSTMDALLDPVVTAVFIAQLNHINLDFSQLITIAVTSAVSSIIAAGKPATGSVTTFFVLTTVYLHGKSPFWWL
ncbi:excitatory amino acid transporter 3-like protein [Lates japonicus]|uniref:Amino acid transporter n=1 Tax=Lates japonicus TaxID=270547 RepID=A0AAD3RHG8_LATJO|nr:excitatory amino acid transporter 3-like protein [Lates japonicus]